MQLEPARLLALAERGELAWLFDAHAEGRRPIGARRVLELELERREVHASPRARAAAVLRIADDRRAEHVRAVAAQLVRAAGARVEREGRQVRATEPERAAPVEHTPLCLRRRAVDRRIDRARVACDRSLDDGGVSLAHTALGECAAERHLRGKRCMAYAC